jgi:hypothetical protein
MTGATAAARLALGVSRQTTDSLTNLRSGEASSLYRSSLGWVSFA